MKIKFRNFLSDVQLNFHRRTMLRWLVITYPYQTIPLYLLTLATTAYFATIQLKKHLESASSFEQKMHDHTSNKTVVKSK